MLSSPKNYEKLKKNSNSIKKDPIFDEIQQKLLSRIKTPKRSSPQRNSATQTVPEPKEVQTDLMSRMPMMYNEHYENHETLKLPPRPDKEQVRQVKSNNKVLYQN